MNFSPAFAGAKFIQIAFSIVYTIESFIKLLRFDIENLEGVFIEDLFNNFFLKILCLPILIKTLKLNEGIIGTE